LELSNLEIEWWSYKEIAIIITAVIIIVRLRNILELIVITNNVAIARANKIRRINILIAILANDTRTKIKWTNFTQPYEQ
jgi:hypothetical protein